MKSGYSVVPTKVMGQGQTGLECCAVIFWLCDLGQVPSTLCALASWSVKDQPVRIIGEEAGKTGGCAGKCLISGCSKTRGGGKS